ncbi:hypothetical protein DM02DRAFT_165648 [Periconia macrospinosa]|uniref:Uncharacterized protein n=1 Tax=Periconia macrospinosa TaxID=97972 RepID=A0A2V1DDL1_9PLEO|nr:hypothetical protein DM02DRAFT_165648 [Periconia macrospinosa]
MRQINRDMLGLKSYPRPTHSSDDFLRYLHLPYSLLIAHCALLFVFPGMDFRQQDCRVLNGLLAAARSTTLAWAQHDKGA